MVHVGTIHHWLASSGSSSSPSSSAYNNFAPFPTDRKRSKLIINSNITGFFRNNHHSHNNHHHEKSETLGIMSFETAKTMCRLVSLYKSLSDNEINNLRRNIVKSRGVTYLNSEDDAFLLTLACAERLEDLDRIATVVGRLGSKCSDLVLVRFEQMYHELKLGNVDGDKSYYGAKEIEKTVNKMEKLISSTADLFSELDKLSELETSEKKVNLWREHPGAGLGDPDSSPQYNQSNFDLFDKKIGHQRKLVRHYKEVSLWNKTFDKCVGLMARIVFVLYARICAVFGPYVSILPKSAKKFHNKKAASQLQRMAVAQPDRWDFFEDPAIRKTMSGPIGPSSVSVGNNKASLVRFFSRDPHVLDSEVGFGFCVGYGIGCKATDLKCRSGGACSVHQSNKVFRAAPATSVGGAGMALRYANLITIVDGYLNSNTQITDEEREELYDMLPANLKSEVRSKLKNAWRQMASDKDGDGDGELMAEGWREAITDVLEWLSPIAHDTLTWQNERHMERPKFDAKPTVLLLQTLHYSDLEKTEAAITNILVGLSCIFWYENRRSDHDTARDFIDFTST